MDRPTASARAAYAGFAVFGGFWGSWGASIPGIRAQAGITDGQLGTALLFVGAGALPAMLLTGRLVDRWGRRATAVLLALLGIAGVMVAAAARDLGSLSLGLAVLGACAGAADVGINTAAGAAQQAAGRPVISRAHAVFSAAVVVASLATGLLRAAGAGLVVAFVVLAVAAAVVGVLLFVGAPRQVAASPHLQRAAPPQLPIRSLLVLGAMGALAFAVENGHQSWSALYFQDVLHAGPATAAAGPAVFAGVVALSRLAASGLSTRRPALVLGCGAGTAAAGTVVVGIAPGVGVGLLGLSLAAAGTAVLFPTLLGVLTETVPDEARGRATSVVTSVAYLGFLAGPVYVGRWADAAGLPGAMFALAALAAVLALAVPAGVRRVAPGAAQAGSGRTSTPAARHD